ncbi:MAG: CoA-binding protein [Alphaproteobacteria bacterium]|nr:CoA-binding protein [Alphaproteobacteria bacterium]
MKEMLAPASIAILGATSDLNRVNGRPIKYLKKFGYRGRVYPVNPKYAEIGGYPCFPDLASIPGPIDLGVIALPAKQVMEGVRQLIAKGVKACVIFSSGFAEMGPEGQAAQADLVALARAGGMRICGPNTIGVVNAFDGMTANFSQYLEREAPPGPVGFVSQSGAFGTAIAALALERGLGLGYFVNTGNECDFDFADAVGALIEDPRIRVIAGYIEGIKDGRKLLAVAARAIQLGKPIVITKVGRTGAGARAAASHTGALAGADAVLDGVLRQKGIIRADDEVHMLDIVEAFAYCPVPAGRGVGLVTQSGGAGVLMADRAEELGLQVPRMGEATQVELRKIMPAFGSAQNPVDLTATFIAEPALLRDAMKLVLADPAVHTGIFWFQLMDRFVDILVEIFTDIHATAEKPFMVAWVAGPPEGIRRLRALGLCVMRGAVPMINAIAAMARYGEARRRLLAESEPQAVAVPSLPPAAGPVATLAAAEILTRAGVGILPVALAQDAEAAVAAANHLGYPVAVKIESPDIPHKTEADGVRLGLADAAAVRAAFAAVTEAARRLKPAAHIAGVVVQRMADSGAEMVIGVSQDPVFGPVVMVGLGGIFVEVLKDVAFAAAPMTAAEAEVLLASLRGGRILDGVRGRAAADRASLRDLLVRVSLLAAAAGPRLAELDLNPVMAGPRGAAAADWLMILNHDNQA